ncbi:FAD/NAD(P)-binding protein [Teredinibacter purpureus]|uniref:FAD/NAD(P)-binding protein n=1 Tax=Teredinibacter purpureus TaxID=2731756 RepID=UPI0009E3AA3C|nr:FAD/NAD(P)-binding protein [Teredinibacter purpureus]
MGTIVQDRADEACHAEKNISRNAYIPMSATIVERKEETPTIFTWKLRLDNDAMRDVYQYQCGQFNMVYLFGIGEVAISIMGSEGDCILHTIQAVGRVTNAMAKLLVGQRVGIRGPFGHGWPMLEAKSRDLVFITGGLGCAPAVSAIREAMAHREEYGRIVIMQTVLHRHDMLWEPQYDEWRKVRATQVLLASDRDKTAWPNWKHGRVAALFKDAHFDVNHCTVMCCGPHPMMTGTSRALLDMGVNENTIYLSLERNMQCALGHCGHCQMDEAFVCKDGPVFTYKRIKDVLERRGF